MIGIFVQPSGSDEFLLSVSNSPAEAKRIFVDWYSKINYGNVSVRYSEVVVEEKKDAD